MRLKLIACEILYREVCAVVARSVNQVDVEFMTKGLHDIGQQGMFDQLRATLDGVDTNGYDAVLLGYGLCSNGLVGLQARDVPLVVPRAHDCITLFLGSKERYLEYFHEHPGVYFKTSGWLERGDQLEQLGGEAIQNRSGMNQTYDDLVAKYGEDNAKFLFEQLCDMTHNYGQMTFIEMGIEPDDRFERLAEQQAEKRNWKYEKLKGDLTLLHQLVDGNWDDPQFLVVPPNHRIASSFDHAVVKAEPVDVVGQAPRA